jgi:RNA polymerase sigma-70 factor (ECF subfamily)
VPSAPDLDEAAATFTDLRPRLFGIAYRMLGSVADADDVVQDAWIRWQEYDRSAVRDPAAFLATTTTRLAINELQSARVRRGVDVGPWLLREPTDAGDDPELTAERDEALGLAMLLLLERLSPTERAAYVLREAFAYPYDRIAAIVQTSEANARQLVSRARRHIAVRRHRPVRRADRHRLHDAFLDAAHDGDLDALESAVRPPPPPPR